MSPSLLILVLCSIAAQGAKLPKTWKACRRSDPKMNDCLKEAVQGAVKSMINGNPKLGVLPLDPLRFNSLLIDQGSGPVSINLQFSGLDIKGIKDSVIDEIIADWDNFTLTGKSHFDTVVEIKSDYSVNGKVLVLPIAGSGRCDLKFDNFKADIALQGKEVSRGGETYMEVVDFNVIIDTTRLHVNFENLFNGDKALGDNMNKFLNENWREILDELKPSVSKALSLAIREIANRIFLKIPITKIAPP